MLPEIPAWFGALAAVVPPALKWWWGRALARRPDDPLLPERLQAQRRRTGAALVTAAVLLIFAWPSRAPITVSLMLALHVAAGFPLRRVLYNETWSLAACVWFFARLNATVFGLWVLIGVSPWIVKAAGRFDVIAAVALAGILIAWNRDSTGVIRRALRAQPVTDPALIGRFDALVAASGLARPRFEYVAMHGGVLANAVALPSLRDPGVLFTDTLLSRLTLDEITAICAHELAHLEYYDRARMRRFRTGTIVMIVAGAMLAPLSRAVFGTTGSLVLMMWPVAMVVALAIRARHRQQNETASDLRAVALTGDAEALASALTRLHAIARVPRRWDQQREQQASHPSLARRIRDIRAHAGKPETAIEAPVTFQDANGSVAATFEAARVSWQLAPGITQMLDYDALVELRLDVPASGAPSLIAVDRRKQRWQMTPKAGELAALQAVLDRVDGRLTREASASPFSLSLAVKSVVKGFGWILAVIAAQFVFAFVALRGTIGSELGGGLDLPVIATGLCAVMACALLAFGWFRGRQGQGQGLRLQWTVPAVVVAVVLVTLLTDLSGASALKSDITVAPAATLMALSGPPAAVFEIPFNVQVVRLSPHGRLAAVVRQMDGDRRAENAPRAFNIAGARGAVVDIEADDLAFIDDTHALALTVRPGRTEICEIDVASGTRDWRLQLPAMRSATITYRTVTNTWSVAGHDDSGRLARATGTVGGNDLRATAWPSPAGAASIDGWAATGASAIAVENRAGGRDEARLWMLRGPQPAVARTMIRTTCGSDPAIERRLLCAVHDGRVTRIFAYDAESGAWGGLAVIDAAFQMGEQTSPGWLTGWSGATPVALRLSTGELVQPPPAVDDEPPSMLTVSGSMLATVAPGDLGSRIRVYRLNQF
jgi:heat shock protein HtpX